MLPVLLALFFAGGSTGWRLWSPREELAPAHTQAASGELTLEGRGNPAVFGGWERTYPDIKPGRWYRLQVRYTASGLDYEPLQLPIRLDWQSASGKRAGQPDYAWRTTTVNGARLVTLDAPAPPNAAAVNVQLLLQNAPNAKVTWSDIQLTPVAAPAVRNVKVAAIRLRPKGADPVAAFLQLARAEVKSGADVILLPEGISVVGTGKSYAAVAETIPGPTTARLAALAVEKHAYVVAGIYERDGRVIYNTAVLLDRSGRVAGKYRKVYIPREELEGGITPGSAYPVFQTDFGTVGLLICWDVQYADPARALARQGAELLLMPIWGGNETLAQARAIENHVYLASSGYNFPSLLMDPLGRTLVRTEQDATVATATIDLNQRLPDEWLGDMRGRFHRELRLDLPPR
jgi:predicted amidohydrolase